MILQLPNDVGRASWVEIALTAAVTAMTPSRAEP